MKAISLWSGGKDSCLAYYKARSEGHKIAGLLNFANAEGKGSISHGLSAETIARQAAMTGITFFQEAMPKEGYRDRFKAVIERFKKEMAIEGIVFGDIYLQEHKDWIDKVCAELAVMAIMPLWGKDTAGLIEEFIKSGFRAVVVAVNARFLDDSWIGREVDDRFVRDLKAKGGIDLCGEKGEFHTFVYDGPIFKKAVSIA